MEESAREDDMMTTMMIRVRSHAAVVCAVVLRLKTFIQNPTNKKKIGVSIRTKNLGCKSVCLTQIELLKCFFRTRTCFVLTL